MFRLRNPSNNLQIYAIQISGTEEVNFDIENNNALVVKKIADEKTLKLENSDRTKMNAIYCSFSLLQFKEGDFA